MQLAWELQKSQCQQRQPTFLLNVEFWGALTEKRRLKTRGVDKGHTE